MKLRTRARALALLVLYETDLSAHLPGDVLKTRLEETTLPPDLAEFARVIIFGVMPLREILDRVIAKYAPEWPMDQIAAIERNILRMAIGTTPTSRWISRRNRSSSPSCSRWRRAASSIAARPVMWSPVEKTALAEAEVEYEDIVPTQVDVAFEITESPIAELVGAYAVIWTTTPWTVPVNQALAYGPEVQYGLVEAQGLAQLAGKKFLIARQLVTEFNQRLDKAFGTKVLLKGEGSFKGSDLAGTVAHHPMAKLFQSPLSFRGGDGAPVDGVGTYRLWRGDQ